jgi:hypothetical protein
LTGSRPRTLNGPKWKEPVAIRPKWRDEEAAIPSHSRDTASLLAIYSHPDRLAVKQSWFVHLRGFLPNPSCNNDLSAWQQRLHMCAEWTEGRK